MADTTTLNESFRVPLDGTESIRLATSGANWKAQVNQPNNGGVAWPFGTVAGGTTASSILVLESTTGTGTSDLVSIRTGSQSERVRVDTGGRTIFGNQSNQQFNELVQLVGGTGTTSGNSPPSIAFYAFNSIVQGSSINFYTSNNAAVGGQGAITSGLLIGANNFFGSDGTSFQECATITVNADATFTTNSVPTKVTIQTCGNNTTLTNAFLVNSKQQVLAIAPGAGLGYGTGFSVGGTVTQLTSKSTGVTLNKLCGQITMNNAALANGVTVVFTVTNNTVAAADTIIVNIQSGATGTGGYIIQAEEISAGSFNIAVRNVSGGSASDALVLNFTVIKSSST